MSCNGRVCPQCEIELRPLKNGVHAIEMAVFGPIAIWQADLWHCPECGLEVLVGFGKKPCIEHFNEGWDTVLDTTYASEKLGDRVICFWMNRQERTQYQENHAKEVLAKAEKET